MEYKRCVGRPLKAMLKEKGGRGAQTSNIVYTKYCS